MMMKRAVFFLLSGVGVAALMGCPIYPDQADHRVCVGSDCYYCPDPYYSSNCYDYACHGNADCPDGYTCGTDLRCHVGGTTPSNGSTCAKPSDCPAGSNCGADDECHAGDCSTSGCPSSFVCKLSGGTPTCVAAGATDGGASGCSKDSDCPTPAGSKCLSGVCTAPSGQCADGTQCGAGEQCVQGACTPTCDADTPCPTGYSCDTNKGVCTGNPGPCTSTAQCSGGDVCVEQHCVAPCGAGGQCADGLVCVDGGCIPNQQPVFSCNADGESTGCAQGSTCLRHSCYIECDPEAGADACKNADQFNQCKAVTTSTGTYNVCGSANNLGSDCDPTQNKSCTDPLVCIDGFCR